MIQGSRLQFLRFASVGVAGFVVDSAALYFSLWILGSGPYLGRVFSYLIAATSTWLLNRQFTFASQRSTRRLQEWARFLAANSAGGLVNYAVYAALVAVSDTIEKFPIIGVAAGSLAGLIINFTLSRRIVFTGDRARP